MKYKNFAERQLDNMLSKILYMSKLLDVIVITLNELITSDDFYDKLSEIIASYQGKYYVFFEYFYVNHHTNYARSVSIQKMGYLSIIEYDKLKSKKFLKYLLRKMLNENVEKESIYDRVFNDETIIYIPNLQSIISKLSESISEAYSDLMIVSIMDLNFKDYINFFEKWIDDLNSIYENESAAIWYRLSFIAKYMQEDLNDYVKLKDSLEIEYCKQIGVIDEIGVYFESLRSSFEKAYQNVIQNDVLNKYIQRIKNDKNKKFEAIYDVFMNLL